MASVCSSVFDSWKGAVCESIPGGHWDGPDHASQIQPSAHEFPFAQNPMWSNLVLNMASVRLTTPPVGSSFVEYAVDVSQSGSLLTRSWKRYTEFESLHAKLLKQAGLLQIGLPVLPAKIPLRGKDTSIVKQRLHLFRVYLAELVRICNLDHSRRCNIGELALSECCRCSVAAFLELGGTESHSSSLWARLHTSTTLDAHLVGTVTRSNAEAESTPSGKENSTGKKTHKSFGPGLAGRRRHRPLATQDANTVIVGFGRCGSLLQNAGLV